VASKKTLADLGSMPTQATLATLGMTNAAPLTEEDIARLIAAGGAMPQPDYIAAMERMAAIRRQQMMGGR
jgi:hypothetical protein